MTTTDPLKGFGTKQTNQSLQAPDRSEQVKNNAGGYVFEITPVVWLRRFLTIGTIGGTYYVGQDALTQEAGHKLLEFTKTDFLHKQMVDEIVEISLAGRAPKQNPTLFALAIACQHGSTESKQYARKQITKVVRTGTHLFIFVGYLQQFGGWSRGLRKAVGAWYTEKDADQLAYQLVKYRQREGYTHRDVLRLTHPKIEEPTKRAAIEWTLDKPAAAENVPEMLYAFDYAQRPDEDIPKILETVRLPWEALPDSAMNDTKVWDKLLDNGMPIGALLRQLPRLTQLGMVPQMGGRTDDIVKMLHNPVALEKARIHPVNVLIALATYRGGHSLRGSGVWQPSAKIVDALDEMFYLSFGYIEPAGKRTMDAMDVSASMTWNHYKPPGIPLTPREIAAAMAMVSVRTEPDQITTAFRGSSRYMELDVLPLSKRQRLDDVLRTIASLPHGGTDCSLPIIYAMQQELAIDTFTVYTDNETWAGNIHPYQALAQYRKTMGVDAKLVVVACTPTKFSIADPRDPGMLDISGFDSAVPTLISDFSAGRV